MHEMKFAGFWLRALAFVIDNLILWIPVSVFSWLLSFLANPGFFVFLSFVGQFVIYGLYYGLLESSEKGATLGKQLVGLRVVDIDGNRLTFARALTRYLLMSLSMILLCIGYLMVFWTKKKQALHDKIAECLVIRVQKNPALAQATDQPPPPPPPSESSEP